ncbi:integrase [Psychrobacter sp. L7]|uniref:tyrosine-type recombinase/integrase n=1 Tax=Psychrobacter sp. L7 TaxID=1982756 RepID=UPI000C296A6E|nr:site-specific integrase [Psychrobacter sp. L7]PJX21284.1 integrase [Psychrobacter sp. L7]
MINSFGTTSFSMSSGERYCLVIDRITQLPIYHPNLFITTQLRNKSDSFSTMLSAANNIAIFLRFLDDRDINLEERVLCRELFETYELDDLRDYTQRRFSKVADEGCYVGNEGVVSSITHYMRLTTIAQYLSWYANHLIKQPSTVEARQIKRVETQIKARRPVKKGRNRDQDRSLNDDQLEVLFEVIKVGSEYNPFGEQIQRRNRLMILILYHLGIRGGELLNLRVSDIDFSKHQLKVVRRADDKNDPRVQEPNAKTLERTTLLGEILSKEIHEYITKDRRKVTNAKRNDFLFVTHKEGPTVGQPISKSSYYKVLNIVKTVSPDLYKLTGHKLRHTWNRKFSEKMDSMDESVSEEKQEQFRSYLMGWKQGSGTAMHYNKRFIQEQAQKAALALQSNSGTRLPKQGL